jgi:hypothetical protein
MTAASAASRPEPVLGLDELTAGDREKRRHDTADCAGEDARRRSRAAPQHALSKRRQQEQAPLSRRDHAAEHASHETEVLNDERCPRDAHARCAAQQGVSYRNDDHCRERQRDPEVFHSLEGTSRC